MYEPPQPHQRVSSPAGTPAPSPLIVAAHQFIRPTQIVRARNLALLPMVWLPVAGVVAARALAEPALSTAWIAIVVALAALWLTVDAIGARFVDRVVVGHDRVSARIHTSFEIADFEIVADRGIEMEYRVFRSRLRRHQHVDLWWPGDGPCRTIRLDVFAKRDQTRILGRLSELTKRR